MFLLFLFLLFSPPFLRIFKPVRNLLDLRLRQVPLLRHRLLHILYLGFQPVVAAATTSVVMLMRAGSTAKLELGSERRPPGR